MENNSGVGIKRDDDEDDNQMNLPPGFRFHPTDEELITHYLSKKVLDSNFSAIAIGEVDMNKVEPWELPWKVKVGESDWYFFCVRDKKYPTGLRTNRATAAGYWKATGKDKEIFRGRTLIGMKKTLVFYQGRAPKGSKSNWVTHEYRLEGKFSLDNLPNAAKNDWVISRVFHKTSGGKKVHISGLARMNAQGNELDPSQLPPLTDPSPYNRMIKPDGSEYSNVHCFSNPLKNQENMIPSITNTTFPSTSNHMDTWGQFGYQFPGLMQDPAILRAFIGNYGHNMNYGLTKQEEIVSLSHEAAGSTENSSVLSNLEMGKKSFEEHEAPSTSMGPQDLDCMWSF